MHRKFQEENLVLASHNVGKIEEFKHLLGENIKEIYVHTTEPRERDHFKAIAYTPPLANFVDIDTTYDTEEQSLKKITDAI